MESEGNNLEFTATAPTELDDRVAVSHHSTLSRGDKIDRYVVEAELGSGGMGYVLKAFDPEIERHVAIKLLKLEFSRDPDAARRLLLREGRAIGQLNHPNVVAIYDVGEADGDVFIIMELVDGMPLGKWLRAHSRNWTEIVDVFTQAGRGLAAAHEAGIIHRDFKPSNVLVGNDGRVRVLDFGLARAFVDPAADDAKAGVPGTSLSKTLTRTGGTVGTPLYMSPEQHRGDKPDARSDVFSFCVALYEALAGEHPFAGDDLPSLRENVLAGELRTHKPISGIPHKLDLVLRHGLTADREHRIESMTALLDAIASVQRPSWHFPALFASVAAAGVIAAIAAGVFGGGKSDKRLCTGASDRMAEVWNDDQRATTARALGGVPASGANAASARVVRQLDGFANQWVATHEQSCRATRVTGDQSAAVMDARMRCLDKSRRDMKALVAALTTSPDRDLLRRASGAVAALPDPERCTPERAQQHRPLPSNPALRERIIAAQTELSEAEALYRLGRYTAALERLEPLDRRVETLTYPSLRAGIALVLGRVYSRLDKPEAEAALKKAATLGSRAKLDAEVASAWIELIEFSAGRHEKAEAGRRWLDTATAAVARAGDSTFLKARLDLARGTLLLQENQYARAARAYGRARRLFDEAAGKPNGVNALSARYNRANALLKAGRHREASAIYKQLLPLRRALQGEEHPDVAGLVRTYGSSLRLQGKRKQARKQYLEAARLFAKHNPDHPELADTYESLGIVERNLGNTKASLEYQLKALKRRQAIYGPKSGRVAMSHLNVGNSYWSLGDAAACERHYEQALGIAATAYGKDHPKYAIIAYNYGDLLEKQKKCDRALVLFRSTVAVWERKLGKAHPNLAYPLQAIGNCLLNLGKAREAIAPVERAMPMAKGLQPKVREVVRFTLGRAYYESGKDKPLGLKLARQALAGLEKIGRPAAAMVEYAKTWLKGK